MKKMNVSSFWSFRVGAFGSQFALALLFMLVLGLQEASAQTFLPSDEASKAAILEMEVLHEDLLNLTPGTVPYNATVEVASVYDLILGYLDEGMETEDAINRAFLGSFGQVPVVGGGSGTVIDANTQPPTPGSPSGFAAVELTGSNYTAALALYQEVVDKLSS